MLNQVAVTMRRAHRAMVLRHPNALDCQVWRRAVTRTVGAEAGTLGGLPTLGGIAVMDSDDEVQAEYELLGTGKVLFTGMYAGSQLSDRRDAAMPDADASLALIEPDDCAAGWEPKDGDLVMGMPGAGVVITWEVTSVMNTVNIPPYVPKYELSPQGDLLWIPGVSAAVEDRER